MEPHMRTFSRWMPPAEVHMSLVTWLVLAGLLAGLIAAVIAWPVPLGFVFGVLLVVSVTASWVHHRQFRRLAADRNGEDIGTFARTFDRCMEQFDPWVVRA